MKTKEERTPKKEVQYLGRNIRWKDRGLECDANGKYLRSALKEMGMHDCKSVISPGVAAGGRKESEDDGQAPLIQHRSICNSIQLIDDL